MKYNPLTRRMFLRGMGGYALSIPLLPSLLPSEAAAQTAPTMRLSIAFSPFGRDSAKWYPQIADANLKRDASGVLYAPLSGMTLPYSFGPTYESLKSKFAILRGLDSMNYVGMHNSSIITTGSSFDPSTANGFGYSIDCVLEESKKFYPTYPMAGVIRAAPTTTGFSDFSAVSYTSKARPGQPIVGDSQPQALYNRLLNPTGVQQMAARNSRIRGATNLVYDNFKQVMANRRIAAADKTRLDAYMNSISELDVQFASAPVSCNRATDPGPIGGNAGDYNRAMFRMEVAALACGVSRIATHCITQCMDDPNYGEWHGQAHGGSAMVNSQTGRSYQADFSRWTMDLVAYYLDLLNKVDDGGGRTLLDNTLFIYGNEDSDGNHNHYDLPVIVAGAKGKFNTGNFIDYRPRPLLRILPGNPTSDHYAGRPYNSLLVTAFQALGFGPADYQKFGMQGFGRYDNVRADLQSAYAPFLGARVNDPLPFLYLG